MLRNEVLSRERRRVGLNLIQEGTKQMSKTV